MTSGAAIFRASEFRDLVSGRRRGPAAGALRMVLRGAEFGYAAAMRWRNDRYNRGRLPIERIGAPVISVGNITLGGTGKTPMVEWLARWYRARGVRVAIVSRGYGAELGAANDEALELEQRLPDVPHVQNRDRVAGATLAIEEFESQLILLDDGFQHRRLARDLDIVLLDALEPFGFDHVFPRGTLREPLSGLSRADVVALSRADLVDNRARAEIAERVRRYAPNAAWLELAHRPRHLIAADGTEQPVETVAGRRIAAFCGIGNPTGFQRTLEAIGARIVAMREFADHHAYSRDDVSALAQWIESLDVEAVVCTAKDQVKLRLAEIGRRPLWALAIGLELLSGSGSLERRLAELVSAGVGNAAGEQES